VEIYKNKALFEEHNDEAILSKNGKI